MKVLILYLEIHIHKLLSSCINQPEHEIHPSLLILQTGILSKGSFTGDEALFLVLAEAMNIFSISSAAAIASASTVNLMASTAGRVRK